MGDGRSGVARPPVLSLVRRPRLVHGAYRPGASAPRRNDGSCDLALDFVAAGEGRGQLVEWGHALGGVGDAEDSI
mgnify:CR=1 FL=1